MICDFKRLQDSRIIAEGIRGRELSSIFASALPGAASTSRGDNFPDVVPIVRPRGEKRLHLVWWLG